MTSCSRFLLFAIAACCSGAASFATPAIDSLAVAIASASPELRIRQASGLSQAFEIKSENALADPEAEMEHVWGSRHVGNKFSFSLSQQFQLPMAYRSRSRLAQAVRRQSDAETDALRSDLTLQAKKLLLSLAFDRRICSLRDSIASVAARRASLMEGMLNRGLVTRLDLHKASLEAVECRRNLEADCRLIAETERALSLLSGGSDFSSVQLDIPSSPSAPLPLSVYEDCYRRFSPYVAVVRAGQESSMRRLGLLRADRWPLLSAGYVYQSELGDRFHGFSLSLTLPVYSRKNRLKAAHLAASQLFMTDSIAQSSALADMRQAYSDAVSLWSEIALLREIVRDDADIRLIDRMQQVGSITSPDYLAELIAMLSSRVTLLLTERDYLQAIAVLSRFNP